MRPPGRSLHSTTGTWPGFPLARRRDCWPRHSPVFENRRTAAGPPCRGRRHRSCGRRGGEHYAQSGKGFSDRRCLQFPGRGQFEIPARKLGSYRLLNRQLHPIFQSVSDAIWVYDEKGVVVDINRASEKMNAVQAENVIGETVTELVDQGMSDQSVTRPVLENKKQMSIVKHVYSTNMDVLAKGTPVFD